MARASELAELSHLNQLVLSAHSVVISRAVGGRAIVTDSMKYSSIGALSAVRVSSWHVACTVLRGNSLLPRKN